MKKFTTTSVAVRNVPRWQSRWADQQGRARRKFFGGKQAAEARAAGC